MEDYSNTPDEHEVLKRFLASGPQEGDIVFRGSNARGPYGVPFMRMVQNATASPYTHAAIVHFINDQLFIVEETDIGTIMWRFVDWLGFCIDEKFTAYRVRAKDYVMHNRYAFSFYVNRILSDDPPYDYTFASDKFFYCTKLVAWIYKQCGYDLCEPKLIKDIVNNRYRYALIRFGNWVCGKLTRGTTSLPLNVPLYYVGNASNGGLLASPYLESFFENE